jgi:hypothetical protein
VQRHPDVLVDVSERRYDNLLLSISGLKFVSNKRFHPAMTVVQLK